MIATTTEPPPWWGELFRRRHEKARELVLRHLGAAKLPLSTQHLDRCLPRHERREVEHALDALRAEGKVRREVRVEYPRHARAWVEPVPVTYWSLR